MQSNPVLRKLGLSNNDRAVIFHADDIGMCQASLAAYADLVDFGLLSAASVMVPCPWFPATAAFCRDHPDKVDMGVHLTLTSEWDGYRWGPISTREPDSGLMDDAGYFYFETEPVQEHGDPDAVRREIEAQVERALAAGLDLTHVDSHMGTVFHPKFMAAFIQVALQHRLPPLLLRKGEAELQEMGVDSDLAGHFAQQLQAFEAQGMPLLDDAVMMPLDQPKDRVGQVQQVLQGLSPGITYLVIHPALDTPELRAVSADWPSRVADYQAFTNETLRSFVQGAGIQVIGWRIVRDLMRAG